MCAACCLCYWIFVICFLMKLSKGQTIVLFRVLAVLYNDPFAFMFICCFFLSLQGNTIEQNSQPGNFWMALADPTGNVF